MTFFIPIECHPSTWFLHGSRLMLVGMCTGVIVHDLSCSILFYPDVLFIMCHTIHLRCCVIHSFSFGCLFTH